MITLNSFHTVAFAIFLGWRGRCALSHPFRVGSSLSPCFIDVNNLRLRVSLKHCYITYIEQKIMRRKQIILRYTEMLIL